MTEDSSLRSDYSEIIIKSDSVGVYQIPITFEWNPQEDVTAYELACAIPYITAPGRPIFKDDDICKESWFRHLKVI